MGTRNGAAALPCARQAERLAVCKMAIVVHKLAAHVIAGPHVIARKFTRLRSVLAVVARAVLLREALQRADDAFWGGLAVQEMRGADHAVTAVASVNHARRRRPRCVFFTPGAQLYTREGGRVSIGCQGVHGLAALDVEGGR